MKPVKAERGWALRDPNGDAVVNPDGFVVWFASRKAAVQAMPRVAWSRDNEWWQVA
jgi:ribosomal protein L24E